MSHFTTGKKLKEKCEIEGECSEWNEFLSEEIARYEQQANEGLLSITGVVFFALFWTLLLFLVPHKKKVRSFIFWIAETLFMLSPVIIITVGGALTGFAITLGSCFKQTCSSLEENAIFIVPILAFFISLPISVVINKKIGARFSLFLKNKKQKFWHSIAAVLFIITIIVAGVSLYNIQEYRSYNIERVKNL
ncbi:MAG: hypothetical protein R3346_04535 [Candidatus Spechtbacterales bacterium]|nr:hypothetical protein [Candidatus Spechtbacterales bacterium]